ncbi:MAG: GNAT family N-acetyltransferase [Acidimicrobiales bacterium]
MRDIEVAPQRTARIGSWRSSAETATIATYIDQPLDAAAVRACLDHLVTEGYRRVVTAALEPREQAVFAGQGFSQLRSLTLLRRELGEALPPPAHRLRRVRSRRATDVLPIDHAAFDEFWRFDATALHEAIQATPHHLLRATAGVPAQGYALTGLANDRGYIQRLAVTPEVHGRGLGTALLVDALRWLRRRGAHAAFVNTQDDNIRATELYRRHGFEPVPGGLAMMGIDLQ